MKPLWEEYPGYEMGCAGWRMGGGEDYYDAWWEFWDDLSDAERLEYKEKHPVPVGWEGFYNGRI